MAFKDKTLECSDCGSEFTFSADEQELFQSRGYTNEPKRCSECRDARKTSRYGNTNYGYSYHRKMFPVVCSDCGRETEVPFLPREGRPVYCRDCYNKARLNR